MQNNLTMRNSWPEDHPRIIAVLSDWWGGRDLSVMLPRLFLEHFNDTSFVVEEEGRLVAFLIGFFSQSRKDEGYIHFSGVAPGYRGRGIGRDIYYRFFRCCAENGRARVLACTSPVNKGSIAFHRRLGFTLKDGDSQIDGVPITRDYNRPGDPKVLFVRELAAGAGT